MILIVGATGSLGGQIARGLLANGHPVRILVREGSDFAPLVQAGAEPVFGDLKDAASLLAPCAGIDAVVTTAISIGRGGEDTVDAVEDAGYASLIEAAGKAGVGQFVYTSLLNAHPSSPIPFVAAKARTEERLIASGLTWTILAPNAFMDVWLAATVAGPALSDREVVYVGAGRTPHAFVHSRDVASVACAAVGNPRAFNRRLPIVGPEQLSLSDVVGVFEETLGRPIPHRGVAPGDPVPGLPPAIAGMLAMFELPETAIDGPGIAAEFGVPLTSVREWARSLLLVPGG